MYTLDIPLRVVALVILSVILFTTGPALSDFSASSITEFVIFYANLFIFFFAGIFMRGSVNRRFCIVLGVSIILCHLTFYTFLHLAGNNFYVKIWSFFVASIPLYVGVVFFNHLQAKTLDICERLGVRNEVADRFVGPVSSTNLSIVFTGYVTFWIYADFIFASYCTVYGLMYNLPHDQYITELFKANDHINAMEVYDGVLLVVDAFITFLIGYRAILDQRRPDALGAGPTMTYDPSKALKI